MKPCILTIVLLIADVVTGTMEIVGEPSVFQGAVPSVAAPALAAANTVRGTVLATGPGRLTINSAGSYDQITVGIVAQTKLTLDGKPATLEQLKTGDLANVTFEARDRELTATVVTAWSPL